MTDCVYLQNPTVSFIFSCWASWSTDNTTELGYDIDRCCCRGTRRCHNRRNIPGTGNTSADFLPKFSALYGTAFTSAFPGPCHMFLTIIRFYGEEWLAPRSTPKLENNLLSVVRDCLFNIFAATLRICRPFLQPPS